MKQLDKPTSSNSLITGDKRRLDEHPVTVYLAGLSPGSRRTMLGALNTVAQIGLGDESAAAWDIPWERLRFQHTAAMRSFLQERYAHTTANRILSALRGVLKAAWKLGLMSAEDYQKAASVESIKGEIVPAGRALNGGELADLLNSCDRKPLGVRDAAIITLLYGCGLRRAELVALDLAHYSKEESELMVRGKGNKQRLVPLGHAEPALTGWLAVRGLEAGPLFWGLGNRNKRRRLTDQAIYNMLKKRAKAAGVPPLSPHDFRRTFVGDLLDAGADLATVQKMAGHADPATTSRYDRRGKRAKHQAASLLKIPVPNFPENS
ncbi:MAG: tyrosine-type recombinase/integrase [Ardenticatenaceae bacterium]|nr:tyrosine-type recombinase/integrase [Ardenticatenaceae bacterium]